MASPKPYDELITPVRETASKLTLVFTWDFRSPQTLWGVETASSWTSVPISFYLCQGLGRLSQLQELGLHGNQLAAIPEELWELKQLRALDLSGNLLPSIPKMITQLDQLEVLNLSGNQLSSVQEMIGQLYQLRQLQPLYRVSSIPKSLANLGQLQKLEFHSNQICPCRNVSENSVSYGSYISTTIGFRFCQSPWVNWPHS